AFGLPQGGLGNLLPYGHCPFNAFGPRNRLGTDELESIGSVMEWVGEQCPREALKDSGFGADIWQAADQRNITEDQAPPDCSLPPYRRSGYHRLRYFSCPLSLSRKS